MIEKFAPFVEPPYYAVIFTNQHRDADDAAYHAMGAEMQTLAKTMPGYLGFESARDDDGFGFAVSYWDSEEAIKNWKRQADHLIAQKRGRADWYDDYTVRVAKVERAYQMKKIKETTGET